MTVRSLARPARHGVERHGKTWRIRLRWPGHDAPFYAESGFATELDALTRARDLHELRSSGSPPPAAGAALTLAGALDAWRADREGAHEGRGGEPLRASTLARDDSTVKALLGYLDGALTLAKLTRPLVVAKHRERAKVHPKSAAEELATLKRALRHAEDHGARGIDHGIHSIVRSPVPRRPRRALTSGELVELDAHRVEYPGGGLLPAGELPNLLGRSGLRISEALALRDADIDVTPTTVTLRIRSNKEGNRDKRVRVVDAELDATIRRSLGLRDATAGPRQLFADDYGRRLSYSQAYGRVWLPMRDAAADAWLAAHPTHDPADNPFADLTPHDLRSTFATIMRGEYRVSRETTAHLLGQRDGGATLDRVYDKSDRDDLADRELDELNAAGAARSRCQSEGLAPAAPESVVG